MNGHVVEVELLGRREDLERLVSHGRILLSAVPATWRLAVTLRFEGPARAEDQVQGVAFAKGLGPLLLRLDGLSVDSADAGNCADATDDAEPGATEPGPGAGAAPGVRGAGRRGARGDVRVDLRDPARALDSLCGALAGLTHLRPAEPNVVLEITEID